MNLEAQAFLRNLKGMRLRTRAESRPNGRAYRKDQPGTRGGEPVRLVLYERHALRANQPLTAEVVKSMCALGKHLHSRFDSGCACALLDEVWTNPNSRREAPEPSNVRSPAGRVIMCPFN